MILSERSLILGGLALWAVCSEGLPISAQDAMPMTLAEAFAEALNSSPRIAAAVARIEGAEAGIALAASRAEPAITFMASGRLQGPKQEIDIPFGEGRTIGITRTEQASAAIGVSITAASVVIWSSFFMRAFLQSGVEN